MLLEGDRVCMDVLEIRTKIRGQVQWLVFTRFASCSTYDGGSDDEVC